MKPKQEPCRCVWSIGARDKTCCGRLHNTGFICTRPKGHKGDHVACSDNHNLDRWPNTGERNAQPQIEVDMIPQVQFLQGDVLELLPKLEDGSVHCCVTSPPYWGLRDYGVAGQIGLEPTTGEYVAKMVRVFSEVRRVLRDDGTCWVNMGDGYAANRSYQVPDSKWEDVGNTMPAKVPNGLKPKDLCGMPWRVAFALQADGWWLRQDIIWHKPNPMPESVTDRCTKAHEYIFLLTKSARYYYDGEAIKEPASPNSHEGRKDGSLAPKWNADDCGGFNNRAGTWKQSGLPLTRNKRSVWSIQSEPYPGAHFATFPTEIPKLCILAGCPVGGTVLDPFAGSFTTCAVALELGRNAIGIELNPKYVRLGRERCDKVTPGLPLTQPGNVAE